MLVALVVDQFKVAELPVGIEEGEIDKEAVGSDGAGVVVVKVLLVDVVKFPAASLDFTRY